MDTYFVAALYLINMGKYELAAERLRGAIDTAFGDGDTDRAMMYTCVLGELLMKMGEIYLAKEEFDKLLRYCNQTGALSEQREIATGYLDELDAAIQKDKKENKHASGATPLYSDNTPNTTQTTVFLQ